MWLATRVVGGAERDDSAVRGHRGALAVVSGMVTPAHADARRVVLGPVAQPHRHYRASLGVHVGEGDESAVGRQRRGAHVRDRPALDIRRQAGSHRWRGYGHRPQACTTRRGTAALTSVPQTDSRKRFALCEPRSTPSAQSSRGSAGRQLRHRPPIWIGQKRTVLTAVCARGGRMFMRGLGDAYARDRRRIDMDGRFDTALAAGLTAGQRVCDA